MSVERSCEDCYKAEYMSSHLGESYEGMVSGVIERGNTEKHIVPRLPVVHLLHPRRVQPVYMDGRAVSEEVCDNVNAYLAIYCVILVLSFAIISVDGFSIGTNFSAVASCFNNIGPGFELVGATQNFSIYSDLSKIILSLDMLLGRLEIFPLLLLLSPDTWSRRR